MLVFSGYIVFFQYFQANLSFDVCWQATLDVNGFQFQLVLKQIRGDQGWLKVMPWRLREFLGVVDILVRTSLKKSMGKAVQKLILDDNYNYDYKWL